MQIVIDISKRVYDYILKKGNIVNSDRLEVAEAIINGTPIRNYEVECRNHHEMLLNGQKVRFVE